jgi:hypothetical protein
MSPSKKVPIIVSVICAHYDVPVNKTLRPLTGGIDPLIEPKFVIMAAIRNETSYTMIWIAELFGFKSICTIDRGIKWVQKKNNQDLVFRRKYYNLLAILPLKYKQQTLI